MKITVKIISKLHIYTFNYIYTYLVGGIPTPLKNMSSSVGMMTFPINMESHKIHVPNHQQDIYIWVSENRLPLNPLDDHHVQHIFL